MHTLYTQTVGFHVFSMLLKSVVVGICSFTTWGDHVAIASSTFRVRVEFLHYCVFFWRLSARNSRTKTQSEGFSTPYGQLDVARIYQGRLHDATFGEAVDSTSFSGQIKTCGHSTTGSYLTRERCSVMVRFIRSEKAVWTRRFSDGE